jgi:hypothetical protein
MNTLPGLIVIAGFLAVVGGWGVLLRYAHTVGKSRRVVTNIAMGIGAACVAVGMTRHELHYQVLALFFAAAANLYVVSRIFAHAPEKSPRANVTERGKAA